VLENDSDGPREVARKSYALLEKRHAVKAATDF
jgi:hypothetical protein